MSQRTERIDELLRQEIGAILGRDIRDPRIGFATVTKVETTPDLGHAKVWVSVIGQKGERDATIAALGRAMPYVRRELGARLRLKRIPELHVRLDDSIERGTRVLHLISELEAGHVPEAEPEGESLPTPVARLPHEGDAEDAAGAGTVPEAVPAPTPPTSKPRGPIRRSGGRPDARAGRTIGRPNARPHRPRR